MAEKKTTTRKTETKGYVCRVRGQSIPVDESCGCVQFCDVECYGTPASRRTSRPQAAMVRIVGDS